MDRVLPLGQLTDAVPADGGERVLVVERLVVRLAVQVAGRPGAEEERRRGRVRPAGPAVAELGLERDVRPDLGRESGPVGRVQGDGLADVGVDLVRGGHVPGGDERSQGLAVQLVFRVRQDRQQEVAGARLVGGDQPAQFVGHWDPDAVELVLVTDVGQQPADCVLVADQGEADLADAVGRLRVRPLGEPVQFRHDPLAAPDEPPLRGLADRKLRVAELPDQIGHARRRVGAERCGDEGDGEESENAGHWPARGAEACSPLVIPALCRAAVTTARGPPPRPW